MDKLNNIRNGDKVLEKNTHVVFPELYEDLLLPYQRKRETISHFFARYCRFTEKYPIFWSNYINPERAKAHLFILQLRRIWWRRHIEKCTDGHTTLRQIRAIICTWYPYLQQFHNEHIGLLKYFKESFSDGLRQREKIGARPWPWLGGSEFLSGCDGIRYTNLERFVNHTRKEKKISTCWLNRIRNATEI